MRKSVRSILPVGAPGECSATVRPVLYCTTVRRFRGPFVGLVATLTLVASCDPGGHLSLAGGGDGTDDGDAEALTDVEVRDADIETPADVRDAGSPDAVADVPPESDGEADARSACEIPCAPDDAEHIYVRVAGRVAPVGAGEISGASLTLVPVLSALVGDPTVLAETFANDDGTFAFACTDVRDVPLGVTVLVDDGSADGDAGTFFPTYNVVSAWPGDVDKTDVCDATIHVPTVMVVRGLAALTGIRPDEGLVMGMVMNDATWSPLAGARVVRDGSGSPLSVAYPTPDFTGLETSSVTSTSGMWIVSGALAGLTNVVAELDGYRFEVQPVASPPGHCLFVSFPGQAL